MKTLDQISLKENERQAIVELKNAILAQYPEAEIILFGSKARGDSSDESDMDLLILLDCDPMDWEMGDVDKIIESNVRDIIYNIQLKYNIIFNVIIESKKYYNTPIFKAMPLSWNINKDGIII